MVNFLREGGQWKMGPPSFNTLPAEVAARPKDLNMGVRTDYNEAANS